LQAVTLIIFAVLAAIVLYQLYAVLGRKVGRQPEDMTEAQKAAMAPREAPAEENDDAPAVVLTGLAAVRARDPSFSAQTFLAGSKGAYEMIVTAFAERDRETLKGLLSPQVMATFEKVMDEREAAGETETVEFIHPPRGDLEDVTVNGDIARARVRFLAEHRSRTKTAEGEAVDDRRTAELWTFERNLASRDPNWMLVRVDAAEA